MLQAKQVRTLFLVFFCCIICFAQSQTQDSFLVTKPLEIATFADSNKIAAAKVDSSWQKNDSIPFKKKIEKRHSAKTASWMSAVLPGLGQAYNKRWWKLPIIYAGFAGLGYGIYHFGTNYTGYRNAYRLQVDGDSTTIGSYKGISGTLELKSYRDYHKRNLDIMAVITVVWYALNIVDAAVDAHLFHWNVDDKLALDILPFTPSIGNSQAAFGLSFQFSFKQPAQQKKIQF